MPVEPGATPTRVNLNSTVPAVPAGKMAVVFQASEPYPDPNNPVIPVRDVSASVDGHSVATCHIVLAGAAPTLGWQGDCKIPFDGVITSWSMRASEQTSAQFTIKIGIKATYPLASSIVAAAPPLLDAEQISEDAVLDGWTTAVSAGKYLHFYLDSAEAIQWLKLEVFITRT